MDNELREAYQRIADDARDYTNADRVIGAARRRRTRRDVLVGVAVLAVVAGTGAGVRLSAGGEISSGAPAASKASPSAAVRHLSPPATVPPLPATPVEPATLLYETCSDGACPTIAVMASGAQYRLPWSTLAVATLSPDGAVIGYQDGDTYVVRRLTDTKVWRVPGEVAPLAWAPGSDALMFRRVGGYTLLDLRDGTQRPVDPTNGPIIGLSAGRLPLAALVSETPLSSLKLAELQPDGTLRTVLDVDLAPHLNGDSLRLPDGAPLVSNYGLSGALAVGVFGSTSISGVLRLDATGRYVARVQKPTSGGEWAYLGPCEGELAFQHRPDDGGPVQLVVVRPSGPPIPVLTLPPGAAMRLLGAGPAMTP